MDFKKIRNSYGFIANNQIFNYDLPYNVLETRPKKQAFTDTVMLGAIYKKGLKYKTYEDEIKLFLYSIFDNAKVTCHPVTKLDYEGIDSNPPNSQFKQIA